MGTHPWAKAWSVWLASRGEMDGELGLGACPRWRQIGSTTGRRSSCRLKQRKTAGAGRTQVGLQQAAGWRGVDAGARGRGSTEEALG